MKLRTGQLIKGYSLTRQGNTKVLLDGKEYRKNDLAYFREEGVLYAVIGDALVTSFFRSVHESKGVNFFSVETTMGTSQVPANASLYFSKELGQVKKVNATNLKHMMADDSIANDMIRRANGLKNVSNIAWSVAGALLVVGVIQVFSGTDSGEGEKVTGIIGSAAIITALVANGGKKRQVRNALKQYYGLVIE